ncbi:Sec-independent protein translocase protein TatB [Cognatishimia sp.]|uniref:Sec-independent protein translocase protein TatB n=1 Tax=Cognatishimia sp. TaxID=2211648 RepID=UPI00351752E4
MFDFGMGELLIIGVVALIVVGPKDLPVLFRRVGNFVGKARAMGREFSSAMNQAAAESGMDDVTNTIKAATNPAKGAVDALAEHAKSAVNYDPESETGKLAAKRAEDAKKIHDATAKRQAEKRAKEAAAAAEKAQAEAKAAQEAVEALKSDGSDTENKDA